MTNLAPQPADPENPTPLLSFQAQDLRLGMYIHLNCSWFLHPFSHQQFLLTTESQLATIRGLGLSSILVDPTQSLPGALPKVRPSSPAAPPSPIDHDEGSKDEAIGESARTTGPAQPVRLAPACRTPAEDGVQVFPEGLHQAVLTYEEAARYFKQALAELQTGSEEGIAAAKLVTNKLAHVLFDDRLAGSIIGLLNHPAMDERDILHAVNVSVLAMMVGQQFQLPVEDIKVLGIGALLHDVGEQQLPRELRTKQDTFTDEEREAYQEHPLLGIKLLSPIPAFPQEALRVIEAHHERIDGSGYPHQLREEYLSLYTKIVMVVDEYDLLVNHDDPRRKMMPAEALSYLYRTARAAMSPEAIEGLIQTITVYPPGTIVELVNGAYALVLNINRQARMKPLVLLYVPDVQNQTPIVVDLMHDRTRAIARRPPLSQLPSRVREYLNMERWTSYFLATAANRGGFNLAM